MLDAPRADVMRLVYKRLVNPRFRRRLTATAPDGTRPIIVALSDDPMRDLVEKVRSAGGIANVVAPAHNGFVVLEMVAEFTETPTEPNVEKLAPGCTVGLFVARLHVDGGTARYVLMDREDVPAADPAGGHASRPSGGRAKVVALGD